MTKRYYPRGGANYLNRHAKTLLASVLILAFNSAQANVLTPPKNIGDWQDRPGEWYTNKNDDEINQFRLKDGQSATFDGVNAEITPSSPIPNISFLSEQVYLSQLPEQQRLVQLQQSSIKLVLIREHIHFMQITATFTSREMSKS